VQCNNPVSLTIKAPGYFYMLDYSSNVIDIREQFPLLPLEQTQDIAEELVVKHPADPHTKEDIVMTTDFLITINCNGKAVNIARTLKPESELDKVRTLEKLEIEREYWRKNNTDWGIVTDKDINGTLIQNIKVFHQYYDIYNFTEFDTISSEFIEKCKLMLLKMLGEKKAIRDICHQCDDRLGLPAGSSLVLFRHMVITKQVTLDLYTSVIDFSVSAEFTLETVKKEGVAG